MSATNSFVKLALLTSICTATGALAQDTILLKSGTEIQAKVLEVSPGQIKYRRQDNPEGPTYTTGTTDVFLIRYANGTKDTFGQPKGTVNRPPVTAVSSPAIDSNAPNRLQYQSRFFSHYFTDGTGERIAPPVVRSLLASRPDALPPYLAGQALRNWSYITAGTAVLLAGTGATIALLEQRDSGDNRREQNDPSSVNDKTDRRDNHDSAEVGLALAGGGVVLGIAAVYLRHQATVQFRRATSRYNQQQPVGILQIGPARRGAGVGLTYTF